MRSKIHEIGVITFRYARIVALKRRRNKDRKRSKAEGGNENVHSEGIDIDDYKHVKFLTDIPHP